MNSTFQDCICFFKQIYDNKKWRSYNFTRFESFLSHRDEFENICVIGSPYGLLLYLLFVQDITKTIFVFQGRYPLKDAADRLRALGAICVFISYDENEKGEGQQWYNAIRVLDLDAMNVYIQDTMPAFELFPQKAITLIEDGRISYISHCDSMKTKGFKVYIYSPNVKNIIYTGLESIPNDLIDKSTVIQIEKCWNDLDNSMQNRILFIFEFDSNDMLQLIKEGRNIIVFTRNYATIGKCSLESHIKMYKEIIANYDPHRIIIKPHPNDDVNYSMYFPDCFILPTKLPAELLYLCKIPIDTIASVDTSSNVFGCIQSGVHINLYEHLLNKYDIISLRSQ